ncbi:PAS domain S-box protein [bacterium CPR1]|nr:PAS domain S-box protein [bacterium CPR1]
MIELARRLLTHELEVESAPDEVLRRIHLHHPEVGLEIEFRGRTCTRGQTSGDCAFEQQIHEQGRQAVGRIRVFGAASDLLRERITMAAMVLGTAADCEVMRRKMLEQLSMNQTILDMAVDAVLTIDERGIIQSANRATEKLFGFRVEELLGQNVKILMPDPYRAEHDAYMRRYIETGQARIIGLGRQVTARRRDGSLFPAHLAVSELNLNGKRQFTGFIRDISDVVELRIEIHRRETEYAQREEEVRTTVMQEERKFLSRELHDSVSQALFGIVLGTQAALNAIEHPARAREALDYVLSLAESGLAEMRALILELRPESLESEGLTGSLARQVRALARRYRLQLTLDVGHEPQMRIEHKHQCYRVAMEAMHNVIKHAEASQLTLRVMPQGERLVLEVEDNGKGFREDQVAPTRVGLQSMRERVAAIGGLLQLDSTLGKGTLVRADVPICND